MNKIKQKIKRSFSNIVLPNFDMNDLKKRKGLVYVNEKKTRKKGLFVTLSVSLAICVCLFLGLTYFNGNMKVASRIGIDVNPSIELTVNKKEKVLDVIANNSDANIILEGMDLKGSDINVAINALIGSMVKNGYIDELANSILISVDSDNAAESEALRQKIVAELNAFIASENDIAVITQNITTEDANLKKAQELGISVGKLELIEKLIAKNNLYTYESLKDLSINELNLLLGDSIENVTTTGSVSEKAYIGKDKALEIAYSDAGVNSSDVTRSKVEMDYDDGVMVYEVEFIHNNREYDYEINATNGTIIERDREYDDEPIIDNSNNNSSNNNQTTGTGGATTTDTSGISTTITGYSNDANTIINTINNIQRPSDYQEISSLYREWENKIEALENTIDNYEDELERMYERSEITYANYKQYEQELERIEERLEQAEETLEYRLGYDD